VGRKDNVLGREGGGDQAECAFERVGKDNILVAHDHLNANGEAWWVGGKSGPRKKRENKSDWSQEGEKG